MKLTGKSKYLLSVFTGFGKEKQSRPAEAFLNFFYNLFLKSSSLVHSLTFDHHIIGIKNEKDIPKPSDFGYIISPIQDHIIGMSKYKLHYTAKILDKNIEITFIFDDKTSLDELKNNLRKILTWLYVVITLAEDKDCSRSRLKIYIYFTDLEKNLPQSDNEQINKLHVNTGYTNACISDSNIVIYRKEEWFKVFIHETFHNLGLDFSHMYLKSDCNKIILSIFPVKSKVKLYEAYTDTWAVLIHAIMCSYFTTDKYRNFIEVSNKLINCEMNYSVFQVVKILDFMGLTYQELHSRDKKVHKLRDSLYYEHTSVLSYYVIKSILLNNHKDFFIWCFEHNKNLVQFNNSNRQNQLKFCRFIKKYYNTPVMNRKMTFMYKYFKNFKITSKNQSYMMSNMRKSICELE
jgi:hypothetical protein